MAKKREVQLDAEKFKEMEDSYSGDRISEHQPVRKPFKYDGKLYISVGGFSGKSHSEEDAYQLVPRGEFTGEGRTYSVPAGREYEEYYESLRNDPMGFYHGMVVRRGATEWVLVGPELLFVLKKGSVPAKQLQLL